MLNTIEELKQGIVKTRDNTPREYTILLVGETGTGKTSLLSLLANILAGRTPDQYVFSHDESNEAGGSEKHSQTNDTKLYEFMSKNGIKLHILDTPSLADTRGIAHDEKNKASIVEAVTNAITALDAVLIVANGTLPRLGVATDYALWSILSTFPCTLARSTAIFLTHVSNPLNCNFSQDVLPDDLRGDNYHPFLIDNPVALWKKYNEIYQEQDVDVNEKKMQDIKLRKSHEKVLRELVRFFDWLFDLKPQPTRDNQTMYAQFQEIDLKPQSTWDDQTLSAQSQEIDLKPQSTGDSQTLYAEFQEIEQNIADALSHATQLENKKKELREAIIDERGYLEANSGEAGQKGMEAKLIKANAYLDANLKKSLDKVTLHTESYAKLTLTGSFAGLIKRTVRLLETTSEVMRNNNADTASINVVEESLGRVKAKLVVVKNAAMVGAESHRFM